MNQVYTATLTSAQPGETFHSLTGGTLSDSNLANLLTENYPDRPEPVVNYIYTPTATISTIVYPTPYIAHELANLPNKVNQSIFKGQTLQWWVDSINNKSVVYTPVSNKVLWSYMNEGKQYHISTEITNYIIPNLTDTFTQESTTTLITFKDNGYMTLTTTYQFNA